MYNTIIFFPILLLGVRRQLFYSIENLQEHV